LSEDGLDEKAEDAVDEVMLGRWEFVVPCAVGAILGKGFPGWDENPVEETME
jgi:hypothetical protein